jgi:hypothetical protein
MNSGNRTSESGERRPETGESEDSNRDSDGALFPVSGFRSPVFTKTAPLRALSRVPWHSGHSPLTMNVVSRARKPSLSV